MTLRRMSPETFRAQASIPVTTGRLPQPSIRITSMRIGFRLCRFRRVRRNARATPGTFAARRSAATTPKPLSETAQERRVPCREGRDEAPGRAHWRQRRIRVSCAPMPTASSSTTMPSTTLRARFARIRMRPAVRCRHARVSTASRVSKRASMPHFPAPCGGSTGGAVSCPSDRRRRRSRGVPHRETLAFHARFHGAMQAAMRASPLARGVGRG